MNAYILHPGAYADLDEIWEYIAVDSLDAADQVREDIYASVKNLVPFPHQGHRRPDLTRRPIRFQTVGNYLIAYAPEEKPLLVIAVIDGRRNPRVIGKILSGRG